MGTLHQDSVVIDGLIISKWGCPSFFKGMRRAGLTAD